MSTSATRFAGSIPAIYDDCLKPLFFEPYATDLAARASRLAPAVSLETAAGTGAVTQALVAALPELEIVATDLNQAMLELASSRPGLEKVRFQQADAQSLPFDDGSFDVVVCQFGVMFFPDRIGAYCEARRVLKPGGTFLFSVWGRIEDNPVTAAVAAAVADLFPDDPPSFFERVPFAYHDPAVIERDAGAAGFVRVTIEQVQLTTRRVSPEAAAIGLCQGTPLRNEIEERDPGRLQDATEAATAALHRLEGNAGLVSSMSAFVVTAAAT